MKYHIHIPKLLEFALNVVCDDITLHGEHFLASPIPYPLYLRCITTYADKYDRDRYSIYRFYRNIIHGRDGDVRIGCLYPNILDHVAKGLDDNVIDARLLESVAQSPLVEHAVAAIERFASRCMAAGKGELMVTMMSRVLRSKSSLVKPIRELFLSYGAKLDDNGSGLFYCACRNGVSDVVQRAIANGRQVIDSDVILAIGSGDIDTIRLLHGAYRGRYETLSSSCCHNANVEVMEYLLSSNILQRGKRYVLYNIPSFDVLNWILDHDVMRHNAIVNDIAGSAAHYSGHYFDMLRYLIEQRHLKVPRDILTCYDIRSATDLYVLDYLIQHGADVNGPGSNVLLCSAILIRYWIDKGVVIKSVSLSECIRSGMTVPVLEMMIDKYSINVNADDRDDNTLITWARDMHRDDVVNWLNSRT